MTGQEPVAECTECGQDVPVDGIADTRGWEAYRRPAPCWTVGPADDVTAHVEWATVGTDEDSDEGIETFESKNEAVAAAGLWRRRGMTNVYVERHDVSTTRTVVEGEPQAAEQRSWSLPAPPPDDVTVVHVGDRVRVKSTGRTGVLREIDSRGRHLIFGDDESWITGVRADNLEPAPEPPRFERGFYRLARDLDTEHGVIRERLVFAAYLDTADDVWRVFCESGDAWVSAAALAAAGAVRAEEER